MKRTLSILEVVAKGLVIITIPLLSACVGQQQPDPFAIYRLDIKSFDASRLVVIPF